MPRLQAGKLRERINVQSYSESQSSTGVVSRSWSTDATRWASIRQLSATEAMAHQQNQGEAIYEIVMRPYSGLTIDQRFTTSDGTVYNIRSINNEELRNHVYKVVCTVES